MNDDFISQLKDALADIPSEEKRALREMTAGALEQRAAERLIDSYKPYPKQAEFHSAGREYRERLLMAGNQLGKTLGAGMEVAMHTTGEYPDWWQGRRYDDRPIVAWVAGVTGESTRDNPQRILLGRPGQLGTGTIPKAAVVAISSSRGLADAADTIQVRHKSGGVSQIGLKSYEKGREKWQGETLDFVWFDEEPPRPIYIEGLTRTNATGGMVFLTFTPLNGVTEVVNRFLLEKPPGTHVTSMTIDEVEHFTPERRAEIIASYPEFERNARTKGIPQLGSGRVFPINEQDIKSSAFQIPDHWAHICGLDFGWDHPTAAVHCVWDRDGDVFYVIDAVRAKHQTPVLFADQVKRWGAWLPWAWPHDGLQHDKGSGKQLAAQYRAQGLKMLPIHATFENSTNGVEAGVTEMLERMQTGRLRVFFHLHEWLEEFNLYHRKEGKIVKFTDDLISATRYALMMKRHAITQAECRPRRLLCNTSGWPAPQSGPNAWMAY
jgi:phage terminase large subunit-like protein